MSSLLGGSAYALESQKKVGGAAIRSESQQNQIAAIRPFLSYTFGGPCPTQGRIGRWAQNR